MLSRRITPHRPGRRYITAIAALGLLGGLLLGGNAALAVNATGAFELDGNATDQAAAGDDADNVCYQDAINAGLTAAQATTRCTVTSGTNGASAVQWIDSSNSLEIFTGGGSKDPDNPGTSWLWKPKDTVPDKDTIDHSFAARYSRTPSATNCPAPTGATTCEVIYFGVDRFDNSGDAQLGFWFFKSNISLTNTASQGGFKFSGNHQNGDLLLISQFSNGGTTSTIEAHFWDTSCKKAASNTPTAGQCSGANLRLQQKSTNANCATTAATSPFCGIVNTTNGTAAPWAYTDKTGNHSYLAGEYYEAGVNLSALGIGDECFPSFLAESRSSTSTTATLKDFVLGQFQNCSAQAVTAPSSTSVSPGTPVTDHIFITGAGTANPPFPSSPPNVVFSICGPIATGICDGSDTAHTAVAFGASKALTPTTNPVVQGKSEATSDQVNTSGSGALAPGRYCFVGSWAGDTNYPAGASDNSEGECFTVIQIGTTTVTTPSDSSGTGLGTGTLALGTVLYDKAVVTADAAGGGTLNGTVDFFLCNPSAVTGAAGAEVCASGGTNLSGNPRTLVPIANSSPPASSVLSSPGVPANVAGVWCFRAVFTPSGTSYTGSSDATHGECVTVGKENTTTVTTPSVGSGATVAVGTSVTDHAVVTATTNSDGYPSGTINFFICNPTVVATNGGTCSANGTAAGSIAATEITPATNPPSSQATSSAITASSVGKWCFRAVYVPGNPNGANYNGSFDSSVNECFFVTDTTGTTSAQTWLPNDSATITSVGGTALNGTLSFTLYASTDCTGSVLYQQDTDPNTAGIQPFTLTNAASPATRSTTNSSVSVTASTTVSWLSTFTSSDANVGSSSHCEKTVLTITN